METGWWGEFHDSYGVVFPRLVGDAVISNE
jgi:hypothetical protein